MLRVCAIKYCDARRSSGRILFRWPKDETTSLKWKKSVGDNLKNSASVAPYICELHFDPKYIFNSPEVGTRQRRKIRRCNVAVPTIFPDEEEYEIKLAEKTKRLLEERELQLENQNRLKAENELKLAESTKPKIFVTPGVVSESDINEINVESYIQIEPDDPLVSDCVLLQPKAEHVHLVNDHCYDSISNILELFDPIYTYDKLKSDLHNITLPQYWQYIDSEDGSLLGYLGDSRRHVSKSIFFHKDMTLEIRSEGRIVEPDFVQKITCIDDVINLMRTMSSLRNCVGFNGENECAVGFFSPAWLRSERCEECRRKEARIRRANSVDHKKTIRKLKKRMKRREDTLILKNKEINRLKLLLKGEEKKVDYYVNKYIQISRLNNQIPSDACSETSEG